MEHRISDPDDGSTIELKKSRNDGGDYEPSFEEKREDHNACQAESKIKYKTLFECANDAIFTMSGERFIDCNNKTLELFACTREQIVGQPPYRYSPRMQPDGSLSRTSAVERIEAALRGEPQFFEWKHCRYDGTLFDSEVSLNCIDLGGETFIQAIVRDVSARKRAEQALDEERDFSVSIINGTPAIICGINPDGTTTFVNPAGEKVTGYSASELIGDNWWRTLYPGLEYRQVEQLFEDLEKGAVRDYEMTLTTKDGSKRTISWNSINRMEKDGSIRQVIGFGNDVTDRRKVEDELKRHRERLEELVEQRTAKLEEANGQLRREIAERKRVQEERERLILELREALAKVKALSGLLPICASCKKIRNDGGYWEQLEVYIRDRSEADFSHGLCPDCATRALEELQRTKPGMTS